MKEMQAHGPELISKGAVASVTLAADGTKTVRASCVYTRKNKSANPINKAQFLVIIAAINLALMLLPCR
jgi:hypothetical protein